MLKRIMKKAHQLARKMEGDYQARLSLALKLAWKEERGNENMMELGMIERVGSMTDYYDNGLEDEVANDKVIDFGKHKGEKMSNIPTDYLIYICRNTAGADENHQIALRVIRERALAELTKLKKQLTGEDLEFFLDDLEEAKEETEEDIEAGRINVNIEYVTSYLLEAIKYAQATL